MHSYKVMRTSLIENDAFVPRCSGLVANTEVRNGTAVTPINAGAPTEEVYTSGYSRAWMRRGLPADDFGFLYELAATA